MNGMNAEQIKEKGLNTLNQGLAAMFSEPRGEQLTGVAQVPEAVGSGTTKVPLQMNKGVLTQGLAATGLPQGLQQNTANQDLYKVLGGAQLI